jgi:hypothetical protein
MRWFRSHLRLGARLALFALVVQLVVSFGHVHAEDFAATVALAASAGHGSPSSGAPNGRHPSDTTNDICAICALIQLVHVSVPAMAPVLSAPTVFDWIRHQPPRQLAASASSHELFRARAPPSA